MAIVNAADDDPVFAKDSSALSVPQAIEKDPKPIQAIVQLSGAFVSPPELRSVRAADACSPRCGYSQRGGGIVVGPIFSGMRMLLPV